MKIFRFTIFLLLLGFVQNIWAKSPGEIFKDHFVLVREEGKVTTIRSRLMPRNVSIKSYLNFIKDQLQSEQNLMDSKSDYFIEAKQRLVDLYGYESEDVRIAMEGLHELKKVDFDEVFSNPDFQKVMQKFELKIKDFWETLDPTVLAKPDNPVFFRNKKIASQVLRTGLKLVGKYLFQDPLIHTATYVVNQVVELVENTRNYQHHLLLYFLEDVPVKEYGMTMEEKYHVMSSIYESRIPWFAFWEYNWARADWDNYGDKYFYREMRSALSRFRDFKDEYVLGKRLNYAFQNVEKDGENQVINLYDKKHIFSKRPSLSLNYDRPFKVLRNRIFLTIGRLGVQFVPIPGFIKNLVDRGLRSFYEDQMITEGALYGYFLLNEDSRGLGLLKRQNLNPFNPFGKTYQKYSL